MKFDDSFPKRIAIARSASGLTQGQLAKTVGIVRRQIAAYEAGSSKPREGVLKNLAAALGTTTEWLASGKGKGPDVSAIQRTVTVREIPVYTHAQTLVAEGVPLYSGISPVDFIPAPPHAGERSFALYVEGHSMTSPSGISFPEGYLVCFDPDLSAAPGDYVLCSVDSTTTFKQLVRDQGNSYLRPLNPAYPLIGLDEKSFIIGVAIHSQFDLLKSRKLEWPQSDNPWAEVAAWDVQTKVDEEASIYLRLESIEEKLNTLLEGKANKKPT